jgi:hypothetical protein
MHLEDKLKEAGIPLLWLLGIPIASALVCLVLWLGGLRLDWTYWISHWLSFSSISLLVNKACK